MQKSSCIKITIPGVPAGRFLGTCAPGLECQAMININDSHEPARPNARQEIRWIDIPSLT